MAQATGGFSYPITLLCHLLTGGEYAPRAKQWPFSAAIHCPGGHVSLLYFPDFIHCPLVDVYRIHV